jgi:hypothetical protein
LLLAALRDVPLAADIDESAKAQAQLLLLEAMVGEEGLEGDMLDSFLSEARQMADQWLARKG